MATTRSIAGFAFKTGDSSHEVQTLCLYANAQRIERRFFRRADEVPDGWIPSGNVEWVCAVLGRRVTPDYYPPFLESWLYRRVWRADKWPSEVVFAKPADQYKRFTGFVASGSRRRNKRGPLWCSAVVKFSDEWRYYVTEGRVVAAHWYAGDEVNTPPPPSLEIAWPKGWCGAVDFGRLADGRIALVESQHPFACGWYGRLGEGAIYADWLAAGWEWLDGDSSTDGATHSQFVGYK